MTWRKFYVLKSSNANFGSFSFCIDKMQDVQRKNNKRMDIYASAQDVPHIANVKFSLMGGLIHGCTHRANSLSLFSIKKHISIQQFSLTMRIILSDELFCINSLYS